MFYLHAPYVGKEDYFPVGQIDHGALVDALLYVVGRAICSYAEFPANVAGPDVVERGGEKRFVGNGRRGRAKEATERLVMNFSYWCMRRRSPRVTDEHC